MRQQSGHASSNGWACLNQTEQSRSDRDGSWSIRFGARGPRTAVPFLPSKRIQVECGSQEREFWGQRLAGQIGPTFPAETERPKPTARMPAKCGHISQVSTNPQIAGMRGGAGRDQTECPPRSLFERVSPFPGTKIFQAETGSEFCALSRTETTAQVLPRRKTPRLAGLFANSPFLWRKQRLGGGDGRDQTVCLPRSPSEPVSETLTAAKSRGIQAVFLMGAAVSRENRSSAWVTS